MSRKISALPLTPEERESLSAVARSRFCEARYALRARIILACGDGLSQQAVARSLRTSVVTVAKWKHVYLQSGLDGIMDRAPGSADGEPEAEAMRRLLQKVKETAPGKDGRWTHETLSEALDMPLGKLRKLVRSAGGLRYLQKGKGG